jgi:hypothetical protein
VDIQKVIEGIRKVDTRLSEAELRLTKEIAEVKSGTIKWLVGWMVALIMVQTGAIITIFTLLK